VGSGQGWTVDRYQANAGSMTGIKLNSTEVRGSDLGTFCWLVVAGRRSWGSRTSYSAPPPQALPEPHPSLALIHHYHQLRCYEVHIRSGFFISHSKVSISRRYRKGALLVRTIDDRSKVWHLVMTINQANDTVSEPHGQFLAPASGADLVDDAAAYDRGLCDE